jgi:hypothetical protein
MLIGIIFTEVQSPRSRISANIRQCKKKHSSNEWTIHSWHLLIVYLINRKIIIYLYIFYLGMTAGACGAFVGTPAEVALIRMTSDGNLAADQRRNYKSVFDALIRIFREEGITALWRGAIPTMGRAMVVNAAQLASYSQAKQSIISTGYVDEGIFCHFIGNLIHLLKSKGFKSSSGLFISSCKKFVKYRISE